MNPSGFTSSSTSALSMAAQRPSKGAGMLDTVRVAADTFQSVMFMGCSERKEFTRDNRPNADKAQKRNADGVPVWAVQVAAVNWRGNPQLITVTVAADGNPAAEFTAGQPVQLAGLVFGVTPKREGGYVTWCSADAIGVATTAMRAVS